MRAGAGHCWLVVPASTRLPTAEDGPGLLPEPLDEGELKLVSDQVLHLVRDLLRRLSVGEHDDDVLGHDGIVCGSVAELAQLRLHAVLQNCRLRRLDVDLDRFAFHLVSAVGSS